MLDSMVSVFKEGLSKNTDVEDASEVAYYLGRLAGAASRKVGLEAFRRGYKTGQKSHDEHRNERLVRAIDLMAKVIPSLLSAIGSSPLTIRMGTLTQDQRDYFDKINEAIRREAMASPQGSVSCCPRSGKVITRDFKKGDAPFPPPARPESDPSA